MATEKNTKVPNSKIEGLSECDENLLQASPYIKMYVAKLQQEIERLQERNVRQEVSHFSAMAELQAKHQQELNEVTVAAKQLSPTEAYDLMINPKSNKKR